MRKLILSLSLLPCLGFASSLDMSTLQCNGVKLNSSTTLSQVQKSCQLKKQKMEDGLYQVEFINDATKKEVKCNFATNESSSLLNSCKKAGIL